MKLPDIQYSTATETLGRHGSRAPELTEKAGRVIGQGIRQGGSIMADAIRSAGTMEARGNLEAQKRKNDIIYRDTVARANLDIDAKQAWQRLAINTLADVAQKGIAYSYKMKEQRETAAKNVASSGYENALSMAVEDIWKAPQVNLLEYDDLDIDRSQLEQHITRSVDANGNVMEEWVPTDMVGEALVEAVESKLRDNALSQVEGDIYKQELGLDLDAKYSVAQIAGIRQGQKYYQNRTNAMHLTAHNQSVENGNIDAVRENAYEAKSRGIWDAVTAEKMVMQGKDSITFGKYQKQIDGISTTAQVDALRKQINDDPNMTQETTNKARVQLRMKEGQILQENKIQEAETYNKQFNYEVRTGTEQKMVGIYAEGNRFVDSEGNHVNESEILNDIVDSLPENMKKDSGTARTIAKNYLNERKVNSTALIDRQYSEYNKKFIEDESFTAPPPKIDGGEKQYMSAHLAWKARVEGRDVKTDMNIWQNLQATSVINPSDFPTPQQIRDNYRGHLAPNVYTMALKMADGIHGPKSYETVKWLSDYNMLFDQMADSAYGVGWQNDDKLVPVVNGLRTYGMSLMSNVPEDADLMQRRAHLENMFHGTAYSVPNPDDPTKLVPMEYEFQVNKRGLGATIPQRGLSFVQSPIEEFLPELLSEAMYRGESTDMPNMVRLYNQMVKDGKIKLTGKHGPYKR